MFLSGLIYKFICAGCNATYYGKARRHFEVQICEHLCHLHLTEKGEEKKKLANVDPRIPLILQSCLRSYFFYFL